MRASRIVAFGIVCMLAGALVDEGVAQVKRASFTPDLIAGKSTAEKAAAFLDGAVEMSGNGSWELIAIGRAWYLGGNKDKGQALFDRVTSSKKVEGSDWYRIGHVYAEAGERDKARAAFDRFRELEAGGDKHLIEYGAALIAIGDQTAGDEQITKAMAKRPRDFWGWTAVGGAYLGVLPML